MSVEIPDFQGETDTPHGVRAITRRIVGSTPEIQVERMNQYGNLFVAVGVILFFTALATPEKEVFPRIVEIAGGLASTGIGFLGRLESQTRRGEIVMRNQMESIEESLDPYGIRNIPQSLQE